MREQQARDLIEREGLFQYNFFGEHPYQKNEAVIEYRDNFFEVFMTGENAEPQDIHQFYYEEQAFHAFIGMLRAYKESCLAAYIDKNYVYYYKNEFYNKPEGTFFLSFNWAPLFLPFPWLLYRKMYREAVFFLLPITLLLLLVSRVYPDNEYYYFAIVLGGGIRLMLMLFGNSFYLTKIYNYIHRSATVQDRPQLKYLHQKGGTKLAAAILCYPAIIAILWILLS
jgi:hypothetical protein